jgi:phage shock protein C
VAGVEKQENFAVGTLSALKGGRTDEGPTEIEKDYTDVHDFRRCPPVRNAVCRRIRHRGSAGFGRDLATDRVTAIANSKENQMHGRFLINRGDAKIMGVAAGLADYTGLDATIIRLGFIAGTLLTGPVMILFYVLAGLLAPAQ